MTTYILHGGQTREDNATNRAFFKTMADAVPEGGTWLGVYFAASNNHEDRCKDMCGKITAQAVGKEINFVLATSENFVKEAQKADVIYIHGGSTCHLVEVLNSIEGAKEALQQEGKVIAGSSAGAYALGESFFSIERQAVMAGLRILPIQSVVHYGVEEVQGHAKKLKEAGNTSPIILIPETEFVMMEY